MHPYVELKRGDESRIQGLIDLAKRCGLKNNITWISTQIGYLTYVKNYDNKARLGYVVSSIDDSVISAAQSLQTGHNEVFIDNVTATSVDADICESGGIPLEVWDENTVSGLVNLPSYVTGVTSDTLVAAYELYKKSI